MRRPASSSSSTRRALGQVARDLGEAEQLAVRVVQRGDDHVGPETRAVLAHPPAFVLAAAFARAPCRSSSLRPAGGHVLRRIEDARSAGR